MNVNAKLKLKEENGKKWINCLIRKRWLILTPEEWVRQHFLLFMINELKVPLLRIGVEVNLKYNQLNKRADIVVFNNHGKAYWIIECKEQSIKLNDDVLQQVLIYNQVLDVKYVSITNGENVLSWEKLENNYIKTDQWPEI